MSQLSIRRLMQIAPALVVTGLAVLYLSIHLEMARTEQRINQQTVLSQAVGAMKDTRYYIVQIQQFMTDVGATRQDDAMAEADASLQGALDGLQQLVVLLPAQATQVQSLKQQVTQLHGAGAAMARAYLTQGLEAGNALMKGSGGFDDASAQLAESLDRLAQELEERQQAAVAAALDSSAHAALMLVVGCGLLALFILVVMSFLYRRVIPSLLALADSMRDVASGSHDLTLQLEAKGTDEVAQVATSFNGFLRYMRDFMRSAGADSAALDRAGGELNASAQRTFAGMGQLQGEVEQVSSAMTEVQASVEEVARSAHAAAESARQAQVEAGSGERVVGETIASINKLAQEVERASVVLQTLEGHSDNIGKIMVVIRGVAEQTNLLALNAAIEAARAGEQGRGFAVVADEVRSLALRTQESTEEIDKMVALLQNGTRDAVGVMNSSQTVATAAVSDASAAGDALQRITAAIGSITAMTSQIDAAATQQIQATDEINRNISNISAESQRTVEDADQSSRASEQVRHLVAELGQAVRVFKVD